MVVESSFVPLKMSSIPAAKPMTPSLSAKPKLIELLNSLACCSNTSEAR